MLGGLVAFASVLVVVTCSAGSGAPAPRAAPPPPAATASSGPQRALPSVHAAPSASTVAVARDAAPPVPEAPLVSLPAFFRRLRALEAGTADAPVRVLWLGDSHTQADFWVQPVRARLQARFKAGGAGFVHVGLHTYRHSAFDLTVDGAWLREPSQPSHIRLQGDGVFGLGGLRTIPKAGARARLTLRDDPGKEVRWEVTYRLPAAGDSFEIGAGGEPRRVVDGPLAGSDAISYVELRSPGSAAFIVAARSGAPQILGVTSETSEPGVVVDTCGINGARIGTPLAWAEERWIEVVARRAPALVVMAYGTNEIGDATSLDKYPPRYEALLGRVRRAAPGADCLLVGPTDLGKPDWTSHPRGPEIDRLQRETAARLGCGYFSVIDHMGGDGGIRRWYSASPALAHGDRVHLTPKGYADVGQALAVRILAGHDAAARADRRARTP